MLRREAILHGMPSAVVAVVHLGQLHVRVGAASHRRATVTAGRHSEQRDQLLRDFTSCHPHLAMVERVNPWIYAAVCHDGESKPDDRPLGEDVGTAENIQQHTSLQSKFTLC